ncbi:hypothetical protein ACMFMG_004418 [Clarireedia jacksonii]
MTPAQLAPLKQRLDTLESFMPADQIAASNKASAWKSLAKSKRRAGNDWSVNVVPPLFLKCINWWLTLNKSGQLTIVDLSCPCMTSEAASALFNICLSLYLEQVTDISRIVALDEAHKYMSATDDPLTNTPLSTIRLQPHNATRVFISTQEPTVSPRLLDLCSMTIVHRFSSSEWLRCLREHISALGFTDKGSGLSSQGNVFRDIVQLSTGEALLFAPEAVIGGAANAVDGSGTKGDIEVESKKFDKLGAGYLKIKIRGRITADGGESIVAS